MAIVRYYNDAPPDAQTLAMIEARGNTVEMVDRTSWDASTVPSNSSGPVNVPGYFYVPPEYRDPSNIPEVPLPVLEATSPNASPENVAAIQRNNTKMANYQNLVNLRQNALNAAYIPGAIERYLDAIGTVGASLKTVPGGTASASTTGAGSSTGPNPTGSYATITLQNATTGNANSFRVGNRFKVLVSGAVPGTTVMASSVHNGVSIGANSKMGVVDSYGNWSTEGVMGAGEVGEWTEVWTVGGVSKTVGFTVLPEGSAIPSGPSRDIPIDDSGLFGGGSATPSNSIMDWFSKEIVAGVPNWALVGAGLVGVMVLKGKGN
jgi:hypothetical protein